MPQEGKDHRSGIESRHGALSRQLRRVLLEREAEIRQALVSCYGPDNARRRRTPIPALARPTDPQRTSVVCRPAFGYDLPEISEVMGVRRMGGNHIHRHSVLRDRVRAMRDGET